MQGIARALIIAIGITTGAPLGGLIACLLIFLLAWLIGSGGGMFIIFFLLAPIGVFQGAALGAAVANMLANRLTPELNRASPLTQLGVRLAVAGFSAYLTGGFFAGAVEGVAEAAKQNLPLSSYVLGALTFAIERCFESIIYLGFIDREAVGVAGSDEPLNVWPYIAACWVVYYLVIVFWSRVGAKDKTP